MQPTPRSLKSQHSPLKKHSLFIQQDTTPDHPSSATAPAPPQATNKQRCASPQAMWYVQDDRHPCLDPGPTQPQTCGGCHCFRHSVTQPQPPNSLLLPLPFCLAPPLRTSGSFGAESWGPRATGRAHERQTALALPTTPPTGPRAAQPVCNAGQLLSLISRT